MAKSKMKNCKHCGQPIAKSAKRCPHCGGKNKKSILMYVLIFFVLVGVIGALGGGDGESKVNTDVPVTVVDFSDMSEQEIRDWCANNNVVCSIESDYSDSIPSGTMISQSEDVGETIYEGSCIEIVYSLGKEPSKEFKNALKKAESYSNTMHMSKAAVYDQLVSEYGEDFEADAAQYAIDNIKADWNANALKKAESYSNTMHMSKAAIYDQLVSEYGEQFTADQAQYAIDNIEADWNANALKKAESYRNSMNMSKNAIYDQLISEYGEQFTADQAQYAIDNLAE